MQYLFEDVAFLDQRCYEQFHLTEDLLMEHAADGMADYIRATFPPHSSLCIVSGPGNNGADGIALARLLHHDYAVTLVLPFGASSPLCQTQYKRAEALGVPIATLPTAADVIVDALFGTGVTRPFTQEVCDLIETLNALEGHKIACDIPSGLHSDGNTESATFIADTTLTMGALKRGMYSDGAKGYIGHVTVLDLGISRTLYETSSDWMLLDPSDLKLPLRDQHDTHKGSYGHLAVICGEKEGAGVIAASAALRFGPGLVTIISNEQLQLPYELMQSHLLPQTVTAIAVGMGLGQEFSHEELEAFFDHRLPLIIDADLFYHPMLLQLLQRDNIVLTPHPKEFAALLSTTGIADVGIAEVQRDRFKYVEAFAKAYPHVTLLLKGANVIIAANGSFYINPHGTNLLAKGGSGDVLSGLIGALLAQGYAPCDAAIHASLAHTAAAAAFKGNNYALSPFDLVQNLAHL